jgi:hypothetical protein
MCVPVFCAILMVGAAQTSQSSSATKSGSVSQATISKPCASVGKQYNALKNGNADAQQGRVPEVFGLSHRPILRLLATG